MTRYVLTIAVLTGTLLAVRPAECAVRAQIIPETTAMRHGLARPWFAQLQIHRGLSRLRYMVLHKGTLFIQTDRAMLHAVNAETGETLWWAQIGRSDHPSMAPAVNDDLIGVVNGSYLYVVNRFNGKIVWKAMTDGAPGAGPALSDLRAYVPMVDGMVASYRLDIMEQPLTELGKVPDEADLTEVEKEEREAERRETIQLRQEYIPPLVCRSWGQIFLPPVVTVQNEGEELAAWATDRGMIFAGRINRREEDLFTLRYRLETRGEIVAPPTYRPPDRKVIGDSGTISGDSGTIFAASRDGFVHAIRASDGEPLWRFSAGDPLVEPPVYVSGRIFATVQLGGLHCLDAKTGDQKWWAPKVMQFVAMSHSRLYVVDDLERLVVLNLQTGARLDSIPIHGLPIRLVNTETDRIYLASETGLIQCLHEVELADPIVHRPPPAPPKTEAATDEAGDAAQEATPGGPAVSPFGAEQPSPFGEPADDVENPFGAGANDPGPAAPAAGNTGGDPFGGGDLFDAGAGIVPPGGDAAAEGGGSPFGDPFGVGNP